LPLARLDPLAQQWRDGRLSVNNSKAFRPVYQRWWIQNMQPISISFGNVLEALGALNTNPVETSKYWEFYKVNYPTPAGLVEANYLSLSHDCPLNEASSRNLALWRGLAAGTSPYTVIVTKKSRHALDLPKTAAHFKGRAATTSRELLFKNVVSAFMPLLEQIEEDQYFIEPDITLLTGETRPAVSYLVEDLLTDQNGPQDQVCADVLVWRAGLSGKSQRMTPPIFRLLPQNLMHSVKKWATSSLETIEPSPRPTCSRLCLVDRI
jgi:hypothetical protein